MQLKPALLFFMVLCSMTLLAQQPPDHPNKMYQSPDGKIYVNKNDPIYLRIASSPQKDTTSHLLQSEATEQYANPMYFDKEGRNTIRSPWKVDPKTKKYVLPREDIVFVVYADSKPPQTRVELNTEKVYESGGEYFLGEKAGLSFKKHDELSGTASVYYSLDQKPYRLVEGPVTLRKEQSHLIQYYGVDHVGNSEKPHQMKITLDLSAPSTNLKIQGDRHKNIISPRSHIMLAAEDSITGVDQTYYTLDDGQPTEYDGPIRGSALSEGSHTLVYHSVDRVSNREEQKEFSFYVDKTPPRVMEEITGNTFTASGREYFSGRNKLKFISMDNKAGVKEIRYSINQGPYKTYERPITLSESGNLSITTIAVDKVNNQKKTRKLTNRSNASYVDLTGPSLSHHFEGPVFRHGDSTYLAPSTTVHLHGEDQESGFKKMEYATGGNSRAVEYSQPFSLERERHYTVRYMGYDNLDNRSSNQFGCTVDGSAPSIYHRFSTSSVGRKEIDGETCQVYPSHVVLFLSATDGASGLEELVYSLNGNQKQYDGIINGLKPGTFYRLEVTATDKLGNRQSKTLRFFTR